MNNTVKAILCWIVGIIISQILMFWFFWYITFMPTISAIIKTVINCDIAGVLALVMLICIFCGLEYSVKKDKKENEE